MEHMFMGRGRFGILMACLVLGCATSRTAPIYRYINLYGGDRINLGEPLTADVLPVDDSTFALRPGTFGGGGTTAILARVDSVNRVQTLLFLYDGSESYETKVENYTEALGEPVQIEASGGRRMHAWEDEHTRFELHENPETQVQFWSVLTNLQRGES